MVCFTKKDIERARMRNAVRFPEVKVRKPQRPEPSLGARLQNRITERNNQFKRSQSTIKRLKGCR